MYMRHPESAANSTASASELLPAVLISDIYSPSNPCPMWAVYQGSVNQASAHSQHALTSLMGTTGIHKYDAWLPGVDAGILSIRDMLLGMLAGAYVTAVVEAGRPEDGWGVCHSCFYCASGFANSIVAARTLSNYISVTNWLDVNTSQLAIKASKHYLSPWDRDSK